MNIYQIAFAVALLLSCACLDAQAARTKGKLVMAHKVTKTVAAAKPATPVIKVAAALPVVTRSTAFRTMGAERDNVEGANAITEEGDYEQIVDF